MLLGLARELFNQFAAVTCTQSDTNRLDIQSVDTSRAEGTTGRLKKTTWMTRHGYKGQPTQAWHAIASHVLPRTWLFFFLVWG